MPGLSRTMQIKEVRPQAGTFWRQNRAVSEKRMPSPGFLFKCLQMGHQWRSIFLRFLHLKTMGCESYKRLRQPGVKTSRFIIWASTCARTKSNA